MPFWFHVNGWCQHCLEPRLWLGACCATLNLPEAHWHGCGVLLGMIKFLILEGSMQIYGDFEGFPLAKRVQCFRVGDGWCLIPWPFPGLGPAASRSPKYLKNLHGKAADLASGFVHEWMGNMLRSVASVLGKMWQDLLLFSFGTRERWRTSKFFLRNLEFYISLILSGEKVPF